MRLLWVKAGGLLPLDLGGRIRSYQILKQLALRHEVTLFTFYPEQKVDPHAELESLFERVVCQHIRAAKPRSVAEILRYARGLCSPEPFAIQKYCQPHVRSALHRLVDEEHFDVIVCDFLVAAGVIPWETPCPKILFTHNVEAAIWKRHVQVAKNPLWKAVCWREYRATERAERKYLKKADHVLAVSENDEKSFTSFLDPETVSVIPTGVDIDYFRPGSGDEIPERLVFTGAMDWLANEDAVVFFVETVFPLVREKLPRAEFWVVGRRPSTRVERLCESPGVHVTGTVDDVRPYVQKSGVYVVPLRVGGGTRLKIFEAMAMQKAVVSTSVGAEGLPVHDGEDIVLADEPEGLAKEVVGLVEDTHRRRRIAHAARVLVEGSYSWAAVARHFEHVLAGVRREPGGAANGR